MSDKAFLKFVLPRMMGDLLALNPIDVDRLTGKQIQILLNDIVAAASDALRPAEIRELDASLTANKLPTMTQMLDKRYRKIRKMLVTKKIRNEDEWRLLEETLADTAQEVLTMEEVSLANKLLGDYESRN